MSDGAINFPLRTTHPNAPTTGRVKFYTYDDGGGTLEPFYMLDDGVPRTLIGDTGPSGSTGPQGPIGPIGPAGPTGPMNVEGIITESSTVTLPNTTTPQLIYTDSISLSTTGNHLLIVSLAVRAHSASNDMEFFVDFDGSQVGPDFIEEHKDTNSAQSNWRTFMIDLGNRSAGSYDLDLRFSKEFTGGTAQLKYYSAVVVRY